MRLLTVILLTLTSAVAHSKTLNARLVDPPVSLDWGGQVTLSYEWYDISPTPGNFDARLTFNHSPWGLDNRNPLGSSMPGTISTCAPSSPDQTNYPATNGQNCTNCFAIPHGIGADFPGGLGPLTPGSAATLNWAAFNIAANGGPSASPTVGTSLSVSKLGTTKRKDGELQVTYGGHPLYYFAKDKKAGDVRGEGIVHFGGSWWVVSARGTEIASKTH